MFNSIDLDNGGGLTMSEIDAALARDDLSYELSIALQSFKDDPDLFERTDIASGSGVVDGHIAKHDFLSLIRKLEEEKAA